MALLAFTPNTSVQTGIPAGQTNITVGGTGHYLRIVNAANVNAWVRFYEAGTTPPTVTTGNGMILLPGAVEVFCVASDTTMVAALGDTGGTTLNCTRGEGA